MITSCPSHTFPVAVGGKKLTGVRKEAIFAVGGKLNRSLVDSSTEIFDFIDIAEAKLG